MVALRQKSGGKSTLLLFYLAILIAATIRDVVLSPYVARPLGEPVGSFVEPVWKIGTWMVLTFLYIRFIVGARPLAYLHLTGNILRGIVWGLIASLGIFVLFFLPQLLRGVTPHLSLSFDDWLNSVILVGVLEEIPFRGLILQQLERWMSFLNAALLTSLLFVSIHVPLWIATGVHPFPNMVVGAVTVFILSYVYCYVFKLSGSLWGSIIAHSAYNLLALLF